MKKLLVCLLFLFLATSSLAADNWQGLPEHWVNIATSKQTGQEVFVDFNSVAVRTAKEDGQLWGQISIKTGKDGAVEIVSFKYAECNDHHGKLIIAKTTGDYSVTNFNWNADGHTVIDVVGKFACGAATEVHTERN